MFPNVDFLDWFLFGLFGQNSWLIQYIACFIGWGGVASVSIIKISQSNRYEWFAIGSLLAACWYISIQLHWITQEAAKHASYIEWWWSSFESFVSILILYSLCKSCER
jgi:hypothetical protein